MKPLSLFLLFLAPLALAQDGRDTTRPTLDPKRPLRASYSRGEVMNHRVECLRVSGRVVKTPRNLWVNHCGYRIHDPAGKVVYSHEAPKASPYSSATVDWSIPADAVPGTYRLVAEMRGPGIAGTSYGRWTFEVVAGPRAERREEKAAPPLQAD
jgi:hypothetical protein